MKNDEHPMIQAMMKKKGKQSEPMMALPESSRHLEIKHEELPGLGTHAVGKTISAVVHGTIHSQHANGHAMIEISHIKPHTENAKEN